MVHHKIINSLVVPVIVFLLVSCGPTKKVHQERLYLRGIDSIQLADVKVPDPVIQKGDILSIVVYSDNPEATGIYNQLAGGAVSKGEGGASSSSPGSEGYLVDVNGNIHFQTLGIMHIEGLTKLQLNDTLKGKLNTYLKNPYLDIRFLNARVTILGEIAKPGTLNIPEQKISILDALALSGDLTSYARRDNILVVRENNGKRESARLDIRDPSVFKSQYFYLQQNDMVYVEPTRKKPAGDSNILLRNVTIFTSVISSIAILITLFR